MLHHVTEYRDSRLCRQLGSRITGRVQRPLRIMEVCGTHTVSIFRNGIRALVPDNIRLVSGPGCPVCVTAQGEIDAAIALARRDRTIVATFGDLMRVPGTDSSLQREKAAGNDVRMVYAASDALEIARENPEHNVVFLGVGFETTAPTIAASILNARRSGLENFSVFAMHKLVPPALAALMETPGVEIDAFLLPGHVSVILGVDGYKPFFEKYRVPCAIGGFEPVDVLQAILRLTEMTEQDEPGLENCYPRAVTENGNPVARQIMATVFEVDDARWRGLGVINASGLRFRPDFETWDARQRFGVTVTDAPSPDGCACGDILTGAKTPPDCPLYMRRCTPLHPVGPCMVSSEGTCAAYSKYQTNDTTMETISRRKTP
ncbi:MAG: hydrogenase formation protein HypD [Desulfosudaceae bacterium]